MAWRQRFPNTIEDIDEKIISDLLVKFHDKSKQTNRSEINKLSKELLDITNHLINRFINGQYHEYYKKTFNKFIIRDMVEEAKSQCLIAICDIKYYDELMESPKKYLNLTIYNATKQVSNSLDSNKKIIDYGELCDDKLSYMKGYCNYIDPTYERDYDDFKIKDVHNYEVFNHDVTKDRPSKRVNNSELIRNIFN